MQRTTRASSAAALALIAVVADVYSFAQNCAEPPSGLVSWWPGEGNANDVADGNNGALRNGATFATGMVGQAFSLDGVNDYVEVPNSQSLNPVNEITVEAWYRPVSFRGNGANAIVNKEYVVHSYPFYQYQLAVSGDQYPNIHAAFSFAITAGGVLYVALTPSNFWMPDTWYHVVGTYDGSQVKLYVNGLLIGSTAASGLMRDYGKNVRIGGFSNLSRPAVDFTPGTIDEIAVYDRALSPEEIQAIFAAGSAGKVGSVNCPDTSAPTWPDGSALMTSSLGVRFPDLILSWTAALDNVGVKTYSIFRDGALVSTVGGAIRSFVVTELAPDTLYTFNVEACDAAGNCSTDGPSLTVRTPSRQEAIERILEQVAALAAAGVLNSGQATGHTAALRAAIQQLDRGNITAAIHQLEAFIAQVNGLIEAGTLSAAQGRELIGSAQDVLDSL